MQRRFAEPGPVGKHAPAAAEVAPGGPQAQAKRAGGPLREFVVTAEKAARFLGGG